MNTNAGLFRSIIGMLALAGGLAATPALALDSGRYANVYLASERVRLSLNSADGRSVNLLDVNGKLLASARKSFSGTVDFGLRPAGYYTAQAQGGARLPLVVAVNPVYRVADESRIGVDNAMTTLLSPTQFGSVAGLLQTLGLGWVRERMSWPLSEPERGSYSWAGAADSAINALSARGIRVSEVFHATPAWAREDQNYRRVPDDLRDIYNFSRALASRYPGQVQAWEVWNEPDLAFFEDSASEMAAYQKAAFLGFRAVDPAARVLSPSIGMEPALFADHLLQNGMGGYFDVWNYHSYGETTLDFDVPARYAARAQLHRDLLARYGLAGKPMWATELGLPSGASGTPSTERKLAQASFLSRALPHSLAAGNERSFWFVFNHYAFAGSDWGLFEADRKSPLPGMAALSTATYALGRAVYRGRLAGVPAEVQAMLFERGNGTETLAIWRDSAGETPVTLPLAWSKVQAAMDHLGTPFTGKGSSVVLTARQAAQYLVLPAGLLDSQLTAQPQNAGTTGTPAAVPLVARLRIHDAVLDRGVDAFRLEAGRSYALTAEVYNFGSETLSIALGLDGSAAGFLSQQLAYVNIGPGERFQLPLSLTLNQDYAGGGLRLRAGNAAVMSAPALLHLQLATP